MLPDNPIPCRLRAQCQMNKYSRGSLGAFWMSGLYLNLPCAPKDAHFCFIAQITQILLALVFNHEVSLPVQPCFLELHKINLSYYHPHQVSLLQTD